MDGAATLGGWNMWLFPPKSTEGVAFICFILLPLAIVAEVGLFVLWLNIMGVVRL